MTVILENTGKKELEPSFAVFFIERHELHNINDLQSVNLLDDLTPTGLAKKLVETQAIKRKRFKKYGKRIVKCIDKRRTRKICNNILPDYIKIKLDSTGENSNGKNHDILELFKNIFDSLKINNSNLKIDNETITSVEKEIQKIPNIVFMDHFWEYLKGNYVEWGDKSIIERPIDVKKNGIYRVTGIIGYKLPFAGTTYVSQHRITAFL